MLSKHGIDIRRAKTWLNLDAQLEMYNGVGCSGDLGHIPICRRLEVGEERLPQP